MSKRTTFENELRNIFDGIESLTNKKYIGRAFYGNIDKDVRLKAEIIYLNTYEHYDSIRIKAIIKALREEAETIGSFMAN